MSDPAARRTALACALAAVLAALLAAVVVGRDVRPADALGPGQVALDTAASSVALSLSYLLYGRFRESLLLRDAVLCTALVVLGAGNAVLAVLPALVGGAAGALTTASATSAVVVGMLLVLAVWLPPWRLGARWRAWVPVAVFGTTAGVLALGAWVAAVRPLPGVGSADSVGVTSDLVVTGAQLLAALVLLVAAAGLCLQRRGADRVAAPLAVAVVFAAASRTCFAVAADTADAWVTAGTLLRIPFYGGLVVAGLVEVRAYWQRVSDVAALEERRRIARDLHDGMAQELAFVATQARVLAERSEHPRRAQLVAAGAERALDESRRAIAALTRPLDEPLAVSLAQCAEEVCHRFDTRLVLDVDEQVSAVSSVREALLRIAREAVTNAARHSGAASVRVVLSQDAGQRLRLRVEDDGSGFDVDDLRHLSGRFGLVSMRERAEALGGTFAVTSRRPRGTAVEVRLP